VHLCVALLEGDVVDSLLPGELAGALDHRGGSVDAERAPFPGRPRGVPRRPAGPTADVQDPVTCPDVARAAKDLVVQPELGVVVDGGARLLAVVRVHSARSYDGRRTPSWRHMPASS
jgi:hypothetical protein